MGVTTYTNNGSKVELCSSCIICGDPVPLDSIDYHRVGRGNLVIKVCDNCKEAVVRMREFTGNMQKIPIWKDESGDSK